MTALSSLLGIFAAPLIRVHSVRRGGEEEREEKKGKASWVSVREDEAVVWHMKRYENDKKLPSCKKGTCTDSFS